jgi:hypothetical protein
MANQDASKIKEQEENNVLNKHAKKPESGIIEFLHECMVADINTLRFFKLPFICQKPKVPIVKQFVSMHK